MASRTGHRRRAAAMPSRSPAMIRTIPFPGRLARRSTSRASESRASTPETARKLPASATGSIRWKSSMSKTPPSALSHCMAINSADLPGDLPTSIISARLGRTRGPCLETSHSDTMYAVSRASIDLPLPGGPTRTMCDAGSALPPASTRRRFTCRAFTTDWIFSLAPAWPTMWSRASIGSYESLIEDPAGPGRGSQCSLSSSPSIFLQSAIGTNMPKPALQRNNRTPSHLPSHADVVRLSSRRMPTTVAPLANTAGPTNMTVPFLPPTSALSPT